MPVKRVVDYNVKVRVKSDGSGVELSNVKMSMNPFDEIAVEEALRLREAGKATEVVVVSIGPAQAAETIRTALAMGADDAVLIDDPDMKGADSLHVTGALAAAAKEKEPDIILVGSRSVDYDQGQRGAILAEMFGWPHVAVVVSLECDGAKVTVDRPIEGGKLTLEAPLPVLVTFGGSHGVWNPRYASLPGIMKAKKKPLAIKKLPDLGLNPADFTPEKARIRISSLEMPPVRKAGIIVNGGLDTGEKAKKLAKLLREEAKVI